MHFNNYYKINLKIYHKNTLYKIESKIWLIEDQLALKRLVDTFSNLADNKDVKSQMDLFTEDAEVISKNKSSNIYIKRKRRNIKGIFWISCFIDIVYHLNGQQIVDIKGDSATGISYCFAP